MSEMKCPECEGEFSPEYHEVYWYEVDQGVEVEINCPNCGFMFTTDYYELSLKYLSVNDIGRLQEVLNRLDNINSDQEVTEMKHHLLEVMP